MAGNAVRPAPLGRERIPPSTVVTHVLPPPKIVEWGTDGTRFQLVGSRALHNLLPFLSQCLAIVEPGIIYHEPRADCDEMDKEIIWRTHSETLVYVNASWLHGHEGALLNLAGVPY